MVLLRGGSKHFSGIKPKGTKAEVKRGGKIGKAGFEGTLYETTVEFEGANRRKRRRIMVEKVFLPIGSNGPPLRRPITQFNTMVKLIKLNRAKKIGLRIIPTIRLLKRKRQKPTLILTKLEVPENLTTIQQVEFKHDKLRQQKIMREIGYSSPNDAFVPQIDIETGKCYALIADFGVIARLSKRFREFF